MRLVRGRGAECVAERDDFSSRDAQRCRTRGRATASVADTHAPSLAAPRCGVGSSCVDHHPPVGPSAPGARDPPAASVSLSHVRRSAASSASAPRPRAAAAAACARLPSLARSPAFVHRSSVCSSAAFVFPFVRSFVRSFSASSSRSRANTRTTRRRSATDYPASRASSASGRPPRPLPPAATARRTRRSTRRPRPTRRAAR